MMIRRVRLARSGLHLLRGGASVSRVTPWQENKPTLPQERAFFRFPPSRPFCSLPPSGIPMPTLAEKVEKKIKAEKIEEAEALAKQIYNIKRPSTEFTEQTVQISKSLTPFRPALAREFLTTAAEDEPENADIQYQVAMTYIREKMLEQAQMHLTRVFELDQTHCPALCAQAVIYTRQGEIEKAEEVLAEALRLSVKENATVLQGSVLLQYVSLYASPGYTQKYGAEKALAFADRILFDHAYTQFLQAVYVVLYVQLIKPMPEEFGHLEVRINAIIQIHTTLHKVLQVNPTDPQENRVALKTINKTLQNLPKTSPIPTVAPLLCQLYFRKAHAEVAVFDEKGEAAAAKIREHFKEVLGTYDQALSYQASFAPAWSAKGDLLVEQERFEEAAGAYQTALHHGGDRIHACYKLSTVYRRLKNVDKAIDFANQVLQLDPNHQDAKLELFACMVQEQTNPNSSEPPKPSDTLIKLSEDIRATNPSFFDYYEKNKHRDHRDILDEFNAFVDQNIRPSPAGRAYSNTVKDVDDFMR